jgi:myo-inositol-1(or 4)-monophosphatase
MQDMMAVATEAAREAGAVLLRWYGGELQVEAKHDKSLVTRVDRESEGVIVERIRAHCPQHRIVAEEGSIGGEGDEYCWVVDPLDGTHNFIRQIGSFGVSIGIVHHGEYTAGVIYLPLEDALYAAEKGAGAYRNGRRIRVAATKKLSECSVCFDSSIRRDPEMITTVLRHVGVRVFNLRIFGSSVRTLTYLAEGKIDGVVEFDDSPWDFAAGMALVREAGGAASDLRGDALTLSTRGYVASNGVVQQELFALVRQVMSDPRAEVLPEGAPPVVKGE